MNNNIRYKCDNPECIIPSGGFFRIDKGKCPYCNSEKYHSFEIDYRDLIKVLDDLIKND